ncbi:MAG: hypothetical protein ACOC8Y_05605 [Candidatus Natronoplasma sp.]
MSSNTATNVCSEFSVPSCGVFIAAGDFVLDHLDLLFLLLLLFDHFSYFSKRYPNKF